jgi:hypothetical protein
MVVRQTRKEVVGSFPEPEEILARLPQKCMDELEQLDLHYPGWEKDYAGACEAFQRGYESRFYKALRKLRDKQMVYDEYKGFTRLNELASLELAYPGSEEDIQKVEKFHLQHPSSAESDAIFNDKLKGIRNKETLFFGNRSHPNIVALDELELAYPGWEEDYQTAVTAHCDRPETKFPAILHRLKEKQKIFEGDRTHWRLVDLDKLRLTYPGWQADVSEVEHWHLHHEDSSQNDAMFAEVTMGMADQQQIYLG